MLAFKRSKKDELHNVKHDANHAPHAKPCDHNTCPVPTPSLGHLTLLEDPVVNGERKTHFPVQCKPGSIEHLT